MKSATISEGLSGGWWQDLLDLLKMRLNLQTMRSLQPLAKKTPSKRSRAKWLIYPLLTFNLPIRMDLPDGGISSYPPWHTGHHSDCLRKYWECCRGDEKRSYSYWLNLLSLKICSSNWKSTWERRLNVEIKRLKAFRGTIRFHKHCGRSEKMRRVLEIVSQIAKTESTVYIHGESGTGKELIAKAIHLASERKNKPFVAINCAALPEALLESELFGHEKGAFTGAVRSTKGLFTQPSRTIFLDEIGICTLNPGQTFTGTSGTAVLSYRQWKTYRGGCQGDRGDPKGPWGSSQTRPLSWRPLLQDSCDSRSPPPLRERKEDIPLLVEHFLKKFSEQIKKEVKVLHLRRFKSWCFTSGQEMCGN